LAEYIERHRDVTSGIRTAEPDAAQGRDRAVELPCGGSLARGVVADGGHGGFPWRRAMVSDGWPAGSACLRGAVFECSRKRGPHPASSGGCCEKKQRFCRSP